MLARKCGFRFFGYPVQAPHHTSGQVSQYLPCLPSLIFAKNHSLLISLHAGENLGLPVLLNVKSQRITTAFARLLRCLLFRPSSIFAILQFLLTALQACHTMCHLIRHQLAANHPRTYMHPSDPVLQSLH